MNNDQKIKDGLSHDLAAYGEKGDINRNVITRLADKYGISEEIVEKHIAEWEAGKSGAEE